MTQLPKTVDAAAMLALADKVEKADTYQLRTGFTDSERGLICFALRLAATAALASNTAREGGHGE